MNENRKRLAVVWSHDEHDCECCGVSSSSGAVATLDGATIVSEPARAHCFGGPSIEPADIYLAALAKLGYVVTEHEPDGEVITPVCDCALTPAADPAGSVELYWSYDEQGAGREAKHSQGVHVLVDGQPALIVEADAALEDPPYLDRAAALAAALNHLGVDIVG